MFAFSHATVDDETLKLTGFSTGDNIFAFISGFFVLKSLPMFFSQQLSLVFKDLIPKGSALVLSDDNLLISNVTPDLPQLIEQFHDIATEGNLKLAPEVFSCFLLKNTLVMKLVLIQSKQFNPKLLQFIKLLPRQQNSK